MDEINPALRAELNTALAVIAPQLRGLGDLSNASSFSPDLVFFIDQNISRLTRRQTLINTVLSALDVAQQALTALEADGYPLLESQPLPLPLLQELEADVSDIAAAIRIFTPAGPETGSFNPDSAVITHP